MRLRTVTDPILSDAMPRGSHFPLQDPVRHPANPQGSFCSSRYAFSALPRWHGLLRHQRFVERFTRHKHGPHDGQELAGCGNDGDLVALPLSMHHAFVEGTKCRAVPNRTPGTLHNQPTDHRRPLLGDVPRASSRTRLIQPRRHPEVGTILFASTKAPDVVGVCQYGLHRSRLSLARTPSGTVAASRRSWFGALVRRTELLEPIQRTRVRTDPDVWLRTRVHSPPGAPVESYGSLLKPRGDSDDANRRLAESRPPFLRMDARPDVVPERCVPARDECVIHDNSGSNSSEFAVGGLR